MWLRPVYDTLREQLRKESVLHADETTLQVLKESGRSSTSKSYMWLYRTSGCAEHSIVLYEYQEDRKAKHAEEFLDGFSGWLHADGYQGYHKLPERIRVVGCAAHARRKFDAALTALPKEQQQTSKAAEALCYFATLFQLEQSFAELKPEERYTKRLEQAKPVLDALLAWANDLIPRTAPKSALGKALHYLKEQWPYLVRYLEKQGTNMRYELAAAILPSRLRRIAMELPEQDRVRAEEFHLRAGRCMSVLLPEGERSLEAIVTSEELETLCDIAAEFSRYASMETLRQGFLPVRGGFRVGLCGSAVMKDGAVTNLKQISSAVIRISREQRGIAREIAPKLFRDGRFRSTLLLSPPGGGKTTLLRDLVRQLSCGDGIPPQRITLVDERGEVAVMYRGQPQMDVGPRTDVLDGCPKALAIPMALRAMNPQIIAVDEITVREDLQAMTQAAGCGVALLATIHAADAAELEQKPLYRELLANRVFQQTVRIRVTAAGRVYTVEELP